MLKSTLQAKSIKTPGVHSCGDTLYLAVGESGSKSWVQKLTIHGRRRNIGLGSFHLVSLAEARDLAYQNRKAARAGGDPLADRRKVQCPTFREAAARFFQENRTRWKSAKVRANLEQRAEKYVFPKIGNMRLNVISQKDVLNILVPIWQDKNETARKCRQVMLNVFHWGMSHEYLASNPAGEAITGALPKGRQTVNMRALTWQECPDAITTLQGGAMTAARLCLLFTIYTAARSGECRGATWQEIDLETSTWTIPGDRMKAGKEYRVPLTGPALAVLEQARDLADGSGLIFPSPRKPGNPLSDMALTKVLRDTGDLAARCTVHGFRASFKSWSMDTGKPRDITEMCLAHAVGNQVEQAYTRVDALDRRRLVMAQWADYLTGQQGAVVSLRA